jgi:hypothetical protein
MTGSKKKTFADDAEAFAADVGSFVDETREVLEELRDRHGDIAAEAKPEADEGDVWSQLSRTTGTFPDVERALTMLASTVRDLAEAAAVTLAGRPEAVAAAEKTAEAEGSTTKKADSKGK